MMQSILSNDCINFKHLSKSVQQSTLTFFNKKICQNDWLIFNYEFSMKKRIDEAKVTGIKIKKHASGAQIRIQKDINDLDLPKICKAEFENPDDLLTQFRSNHFTK